MNKENKIEDNGKYKIINSYKVSYATIRYIFVVLNTETKELSAFDGCKDLYDYTCNNENQDTYININGSYLEILSF